MHIHTIQLNIDKLMGGTAFMDAAEFGAYMSLLIQCYRCGNLLPNDDARLARLARCSMKVWLRVKPSISVKFEINEEGWTHLVVRQQLLNYALISSKNSANRLKRNNSILPVVVPKKESGSTNINNKNIVISNKEGIPPLSPLQGEMRKPIFLDAFMGANFPDDPKDLPEAWGDQAEEIAREIYPNTKINLPKHIIECWNEFYDYWIGNRTARMKKTDWQATWRNRWRDQFKKLSQQEKRDDLFQEKLNRYSK